MSQDASAITSFFAELLVITLVAMLCKRVRIPYTIALVGVGLLLGLTRSVLPLEVTLTPDLLFVVLLPALLFEAAIHLPAQRVMANLKPVVLLAVPGMLITAFGVGYGVHWALGLSLPAALVFGALISATDPISVLALFKELKAPKDLSVVVEGESLLNDGAAVVLFQVLVGAATGHALGLSSSVGLFFLESLGGLLIGAGLGFMACKIHEHLDDAMIEVTLSSILAYGSYLLAQQVHVSGVMAVIAAGFVFGNLAMHQGLSPQSRLVLLYTWEFIGFICNSLVFLLIGTQVDLTLLWQKLGPICLAFLIVILARALAVAVLAPWTRFPWRWQLVLVWSGLRGSIAMALAMALALPERQELLLLTFGVVLLSLFGQGLTIRPLLVWLGLRGERPLVKQFERLSGALMAHEHALRQLRSRREAFHIPEEVFRELATPMQAEIERLGAELEEYTRAHAEVRDEQLQDATHLVRNARRSSLREALAAQLISEEVYLELVDQLSGPEPGIE